MDVETREAFTKVDTQIEGVHNRITRHETDVDPSLKTIAKFMTEWNTRFENGVFVTAETCAVTREKAKKPFRKFVFAMVICLGMLTVNAVWQFAAAKWNGPKPHVEPPKVEKTIGGR